jgi:phage head maturation protease
MPWHLDSKHSGCSGWAVVLDATGKIVPGGCHPTKAKALAHLAALNANVKEASMTDQPTRAAVDNGAWDGNAAMNVCTTAADYNKICAGKTAGDPALRSSHKLPHHYLAKAPVPNAAGVQAALRRFDQTQGLTNSEEARRHLEAHMATIQAQEASALPTADLYRAIAPSASNFELREGGEGKPQTLVVNFARFNEWTEIDSWFEGRFMEQIAQGAFLDSFAERTPKITFNHGRDPELGDKLLGHPVTAREADLVAVAEAPMFAGVPPLVVDGLRAGAYGASFRFGIDDEEIVHKPEVSEHNPEGLPERTIVKASVFEAGPVTFPAYANATAGVRSLTDEFRPAAETVAELAARRPGELARMIDEVLKTKKKGAEDKPLEEKPQPKVEVRRFRTREEWLQWMSQS